MIVVELQTIKSDHEGGNCVEEDSVSWNFIETRCKVVHHERVKGVKS